MYVIYHVGRSRIVTIFALREPCLVPFGTSVALPLFNRHCWRAIWAFIEAGSLVVSLIALGTFSLKVFVQNLIALRIDLFILLLHLHEILLQLALGSLTEYLLEQPIRSLNFFHESFVSSMHENIGDFAYLFVESLGRFQEAVSFVITHL